MINHIKTYVSKDDGHELYVVWSGHYRFVLDGGLLLQYKLIDSILETAIGNIEGFSVDEMKQILKEVDRLNEVRLKKCSKEKRKERAEALAKLDKQDGKNND